MSRATSKRTFLKITGASLTSVAIGGCKCGCTNPISPKSPKKPNIVFIFTDDHSPSAISAYKSRLAKVAPTPNMDRIATEGMIFKKGYVTNSICSPVRAVIQTGKHSHINGVMDNAVAFDGSQQTFPKIMKANGYQTAIVGKWHLKSDPTGFDYWQVFPSQGSYYQPVYRTPEGEITEHGYATHITTRKAIDWLENKRDKETPFMLMLQFKAPHRPWQPALDKLGMFDGVEIPEPSNLFDDYEGRGTAAKVQKMEIATHMNLGGDLKVWTEETKVTDKNEYDKTYLPMTPAQKEKWNAYYEPLNKKFLEAKLTGKELLKWKYQRYMKDYLSCISSVDDSIGIVLDYLKAKGLEENTLVMYSSDQGFYLGEHGWFDKRFMYEESFRMPLLAKWPGVIKPGTVNNDLVQNLDFAQTFLDATGIEQPSDMQGLSLVPLMKGEKPKNWRKSLYYHYYENWVHGVNEHDGVFDGRYKLINFYTLGEWEFYDLKKDPQEMKSEYGNPKYASIIERLRVEYYKLRIQYKVPNDFSVHKDITLKK